ncbi:hypothetical protein OG21DRAFT_1426749, partial [Imleria badia]
SVQDPLMHHRRHFGRVIHAFCNVQMLLTNGVIMMGELAERELESYSEPEMEFSIFLDLLKLVLSLEEHLMYSSDEEVIAVAELLQKGANGARADDTKGMKAAIIDWITPSVLKSSSVWFFGP